MSGRARRGHAARTHTFTCHPPHPSQRTGWVGLDWVGVGWGVGWVGGSEREGGRGGGGRAATPGRSARRAETEEGLPEGEGGRSVRQVTAEASAFCRARRRKTTGADAQMVEGVRQATQQGIAAPLRGCRVDPRLALGEGPVVRLHNVAAQHVRHTADLRTGRGGRGAGRGAGRGGVLVVVVVVVVVIVFVNDVVVIVLGF